MSLADKVNHKARAVRGRIMRAAGVITGDRGLEAEGRAEEAVGQLGQIDEKINDVLRGRRLRRRRV
jgi:uncharacterized protein YjbJ (UPF0337 family)